MFPPAAAISTTQPPSAPATPSPSIVPEVATAVVAVAEAAIPGLIAFNPLIGLALNFIKAHYAATQSWPTEGQIVQGVKDDYAQLVSTWAAWDQAHPE